MRVPEIIEMVSDHIAEADEYQLLALAVLERALLDVCAIPSLCESRQHSQRTRSKALDWFLVDKEGFSFGMVCDLLGLERNYLLLKVKKWIEEKQWAASLEQKKLIIKRRRTRIGTY